ncbi:MAG: hypothetical protein KBS41_02220, partial [Oscillospiraceae bacterium]|nr:hypothetical protein [Candidatus Equicaccousia limihippi]
KPMCAKIVGNPDLYVLCKESEDKNELAIMLWNLHPDRIKQPLITLSNDYKTVETFGARATLEKNILKLSSISAYECAIILLRK